MKYRNQVCQLLALALMGMGLQAAQAAGMNMENAQVQQWLALSFSAGQTVSQPPAEPEPSRTAIKLELRRGLEMRQLEEKAEDLARQYRLRQAMQQVVRQMGNALNAGPTQVPLPSVPPPEWVELMLDMHQLNLTYNQARAVVQGSPTPYLYPDWYTLLPTPYLVSSAVALQVCFARNIAVPQRFAATPFKVECGRRGGRPALAIYTEDSGVAYYQGTDWYAPMQLVTVPLPIRDPRRAPQATVPLPQPNPLRARG